MKVKEYLQSINSEIIPTETIFCESQHNQWKFKVLEDKGDKVIVQTLNENSFSLDKTFVLNCNVDKSMINETIDYTSSYPTPDNNSQSFVILSLCIGQAKFHEPALNTLSRLPEKDEESMIEAGIKILEGKMEADVYVTKLFSIFKKIYKDNLVVLGKEKDQESYMRDQLELRVKGNCSTPQNINLNKQILKENFQQFNDLYEATVDYMSNNPKTSFKTALIEVLKGIGVTEQDFELIKSALNEDIRRVEKVDIIFNRIKNYMQDHPGTKFKDAMIEVLKNVKHQDGDLVINEEIISKVKKPSLRDEKNRLLLSQIESDAKYFKPNGQKSWDISNDYGTISIRFRYLGNWINDEEDRYDDDFDESDWEDNDQRIWAPGEYKKYFKMFKEWAMRYPWYKKAELGLQTSEKDFCYFEIKLK